MQTADTSLMRNHQFLALTFARVVSTLGTVMTPIAFAFMVLDEYGLAGARQLALVVALGQIAQTTLLLFGGVVADRLPRGLLMAGSEC